MTPREELAVGRWQLSMIEKLVGTSIIALLGWMAITTQQTATRVAVIEAKIGNLQDGRYSSTDAARDHALLANQIDSLRDRVRRLEAKHGDGL